MTDVARPKIKTSPAARDKKQAYIEGLIAAQEILRKSENLVDNNKLLTKRIKDEQATLRKM